jgi:hypothetical protein
VGKCAAFFAFLNSELDIDAANLAALAAAYAKDPTQETFVTLS